MTGDEMVGWHHRLDACESEQALGVGDGLACCSPWGHKELDMTERLTCEGFVARLLSLFISIMCTLSHVHLFATPWIVTH